ncbi:hypothetical protein FQA39_LY08928 [Lamprigera yunnana]|nr:hypothetical protein FQA39_LY08928 [Lamprigera yunnana]
MKWNDLNILRLIEFYREREVLLNCKLKEYKNKNKRHNALLEIAVSFGVSKEEIDKKIRYLLSHFAQEVKKENDTNKSESGSDGRYKSKWFAFKNLLCLRDRNKPRGTTDIEFPPYCSPSPPTLTSINYLRSTTSEYSTSPSVQSEHSYGDERPSSSHSQQKEVEVGSGADIDYERVSLEASRDPAIWMKWYKEMNSDAKSPAEDEDFDGLEEDNVEENDVHMLISACKSGLDKISPDIKNESPSNCVTSYSNKVKTKFKTTLSNNFLLIKPRSSNQTPSNTYNNIKAAVNPANLSISVNKIKTTSGVLVNCDNPESVKILKDNISNKIGVNYELSTLSIINPKVVSIGTEKLNPSIDNENLIYQITKHTIISTELHNISFKIVRKIDRQNTTDLIATVDATTNERIHLFVVTIAIFPSIVPTGFQHKVHKTETIRKEYCGKQLPYAAKIKFKPEGSLKMYRNLYSLLQNSDKTEGLQDFINGKVSTPNIFSPEKTTY